ncbi:FIMAH domain-containing protein [Cytobacillus purgationiresistens]|uniref:M6 family metalloprotease-like protein n=1 Tax=Cytobacillus purgationiresistens TaxID=863449 RepID=A0ABU0AN89_9BACI|nr:immune inhibitor A domain-containing protein [Cytobacillus purgationiresistens]MDQ0272741.1 M6 family metalloprotease-like protein [Cytobacillus purgationiresistens]
MKIFKKLTGVVLGSLILFSSATAFAQQPGLADFPEPIDKESWVLPRDQTWDDFNELPGTSWGDVEVEPERRLRGALVLVDFPDLPFQVLNDPGTDPVGNPQIGNVPEEELVDFWLDYLNTPQELNNYRTISDFWRENSYGKWGVELDGYGVYHMDHNEFQYGMNEFNQQSFIPEGFSPKSLRPEAVAKAQPDLNASGEDYDFIFILHSGYAETGVWQEFGEMMFMNPESIPAEFGPPAKYGMDKNWAITRYVPWTSWFAAKSIWSSASGSTSIQGSSNGMATYAHEFGHLMGLRDNYNNPQANPPLRTFAGSWELMSSGSFNGPGGSHTRWLIPATQGGSVPPHHMLRNKIKQGFLEEDQYINVNRDDLEESGPIFADILTRAVPTGEAFGREGLYGINIEMVDHTPINYIDDDWRADMHRGERWYNNYTLEVVDRVGYDSFTHDDGVLLAKTRNTEEAPNIWVIDSHPEDIDVVDFTRPDGTKVNSSKGSLEQLVDATFKAGTADGIVNEYIDEHNRIHFYILDKIVAEDGALSYRVAVRHLDGAGPYERGVSVDTGSIEHAVPGKIGKYSFSVTNTGEETDIFRLDASTQAGWDVRLLNNLVEVAAGETVDVPVYVEIPEGEQTITNVAFTATSETDSEQTAATNYTLLNDVNAAGLKALVAHFNAEEEFAGSSVVNALDKHLTAVALFEKQGEKEKVKKHLDGFKVLLSKYQADKMISERAANTLMYYTDFMLDK